MIQINVNSINIYGTYSTAKYISTVHAYSPSHKAFIQPPSSPNPTHSDRVTCHHTGLQRSSLLRLKISLNCLTHGLSLSLAMWGRLLSYWLLLLSHVRHLL